MMHITDDRPPFARVIIESGATTSRAVYHPDNPLHEKQFKEFLELLKIADVPEDQIMEVLRSTPIEFIKRASEKIFEDYNHSLRWPFQPVIDGKGGIIALPPIESWHQGLFHKVPIMTGFTTNEGTMFAPHNLSSSEDFIDYFHTLLPGLSEDDLSKLDKLYPDPTKRSLEEAKEPSDDSRGSEKPLDDSKSPDTPHEKREEPAENPERPEKSVPLAIEDGKAVPLIPFTNDQKPNPKSGPPPIRYLETRPGFGLQYTRLSAAYGHFAYICPVRQTVQFLSGSDHSRHERRLVKRQTPPEFEPPPIYLYQFAANTSVDYGSKHSDHAGFTTYSPEMYYKSPTTRDIAGNMHAYWSSFILSGSPNGVRRTNWGDRSEWPSYTDKEAQGKKIIFGRGNDEIAGGGGKGVVTRVTYDDWPIKECEFWWERTHLFES
jgi:carboxylesterase type B